MAQGNRTGRCELVQRAGRCCLACCLALDRGTPYRQQQHDQRASPPASPYCVLLPLVMHCAIYVPMRVRDRGTCHRNRLFVTHGGHHSQALFTLRGLPWGLVLAPTLARLGCRHPPGGPGGADNMRVSLKAWPTYVIPQTHKAHLDPAGRWGQHCGVAGWPGRRGDRSQ